MSGEIKSGKIREIDFENYSVETDRAASIRQQIQRLRDEAWVDSLGMLARELGEDDLEAAAEKGEFPGLLKGTVPRVWKAPSGHAAFGAKVWLAGSDLKLSHQDKVLLEITFLPKGDEYLVFELVDSQWETLVGIVDALKPELKAAKEKKSERQAKWKARFDT